MIEAYCLDPKGALSFFQEVYGSVHMSGTLRPLDQYVRVAGLGESTKTAIFDSPFPKDNRKVLFVEVETKYESRSDPNAVQKLHRLRPRFFRLAALHLHRAFGNVQPAGQRLQGFRAAIP